MTLEIEQNRAQVWVLHGTRPVHAYGTSRRPPVGARGAAARSGAGVMSSARRLTGLRPSDAESAAGSEAVGAPRSVGLD